MVDGFSLKSLAVYSYLFERDFALLQETEGSLFTGPDNLDSGDGVNSLDEGIGRGQESLLSLLGGGEREGPGVLGTKLGGGPGVNGKICGLENASGSGLTSADDLEAGDAVDLGNKILGRGQKTVEASGQSGGNRGSGDSGGNGGGGVSEGRSDGGLSIREGSSESHLAPLAVQSDVGLLEKTQRSGFSVPDDLKSRDLVDGLDKSVGRFQESDSLLLGVGEGDCERVAGRKGGVGHDVDGTGVGDGVGEANVGGLEDAQRSGLASADDRESGNSVGLVDKLSGGLDQLGDVGAAGSVAVEGELRGGVRSSHKGHQNAKRLHVERFF